MRVLKVKAISLPYIFQVMYVLCFTRPRYQVSVYRTIGPLVLYVPSFIFKGGEKVVQKLPVMGKCCLINYSFIFDQSFVKLTDKKYKQSCFSLILV